MTQIDWNARYGEHAAPMWSGRVNGTFAAEVAGLPPGRALDVGCGEGADAIWLARRGWRVVAIDVADVAIGRARQAAELAGAGVDWVVGDILATPFRPGSFELVSLQYPALPKAGPEGGLAALLDAVAPGGVLLAVGHHIVDHDHVRAHGIEPADFVGLDDLAALLGERFTVDAHEVRPRIDPPAGAAHVDDVILRARRR